MYRRLIICERKHMEAALEKIRDYADRAHGKQQRKYTPERYIVHPVRVMEMCRQHTDKRPVLAAALLHDVLEDTPVTREKLLSFLHTVMNEEEAGETLRLVVELTDVFTKAAYPAWNRRKRKEKEVARMEKISADAQTVKYADILDNCNEIVEHDPQFAPRFLKECKLLLQAMPAGDAELYQRSKDAVQEALAQLKVR